MSKLFIPWSTALLSLAIAAACTSTQDNGPSTDAAKPAPTGSAPTDSTPTDSTPKPPEPKPVAGPTKISISSVQMIQDCPDDEHLPGPGARTTPYRDRGKGGGGGRRPCSQSAVQLALESAGEAPVTIEILAARMLSNGELVGTVETRKPEIWIDDHYESWDQRLAPRTLTQASYRLSMPNWSEVEKAIGESSFGHMFTLELEVSIDGKVQTISSPQFPREEPMVIVT
jgi:hypothetical protein